MNSNRRTSLVLAAAVAAAWALPTVPAQAATFSFTDSSCASFTASNDGQGNLTVSCSSTSQPSNCTLSASPTTLPASGGNVTLTSNCGTVSGWTKNGIAGGSAGSTTWTDSIPATTSASNSTYTYAVTGGNGTARASIVQTGTGTTSGGGGTNGTCAGYTNTRNIPIAWGAIGSGSVSVFTKNFGSFSGGDIIVASFTTPNATSAGQVGAIQAAEFGTTAISRTASLSTTPCSFDNNLGATGSLFASISGSALVKGNTVTVNFQIGGSSLWYPVLQPNTTYYYNIKNTNGTGSDMKIELQKPPGL